MVVPLATKSLMLEFCLTHPGSTRMLFPGGNTITIQSTSASHGIRNKAEERDKTEREKKKGKLDIEMDRWCLHLECRRAFSSALLHPAPAGLYQAGEGTDSVQYSVSAQLTLLSLNIAIHMRMRYTHRAEASNEHEQ